MGLRINQNIAAQNAYRSLSTSDNQMAKSLEKLSSGFRINRAADDAAGLAISEGLRSQVGGLKVAARNAQDGVSVVQTAEGALTEVHAVLQRMRDLSVQAANDSNSSSARANIASEVTSLNEELTRISESTNFNGIKLLNGDNTALTFQVGAGGDAAENSIAVNLTNISAVADGLSVGGGVAVAVDTPNLVAGNYEFATKAQVGPPAVAATSVTVDMGAAGDHLSVQDVADHLNADAAFGAGFKATVNKDNELVVRSTNGLEMDEAQATGTGAAAATVVSGGLSYANAADSRDAIETIDTAIKNVSNARASLGSSQNRLEHTINNLNVSVENLSASESRIRDTDMAQEMMSFTRSQILTQAGTAMLSQANQSQQGVLSLLR
jgi:flagellin